MGRRYACQPLSPPPAPRPSPTCSAPSSRRRPSGWRPRPCSSPAPASSSGRAWVAWRRCSAFCMTLSLWGLGRWLMGGGRGSGLIFGLGIGLAVLAKGPAGLLPLGAAAVTLRVARAPLRRLSGAHPWARPGGGAAESRGWRRPGSAVPDFGRYAQGLGPTVANELARPASHTLSTIAALGVGLLPWTLLWPGTVVRTPRRPAAARAPLLTVCSRVGVRGVAGLRGLDLASRPVLLAGVSSARAPRGLGLEREGERGGGGVGREGTGGRGGGAGGGGGVWGRDRMREAARVGSEDGSMSGRGGGACVGRGGRGGSRPATRWSLPQRALRPGRGG